MSDDEKKVIETILVTKISIKSGGKWMLLVHIGSIWFGGIEKFWNKKYVRRLLSIFLVWFFLAQIVPITPDQNLSKPLDQNVLILHVSNIHNGCILRFLPRKYA